MYVANLTLRGFKSFASATSFTLEPGITCVVGPNGSGKSNVVDALAWVMGEQGAKSLRGGKMEDVIFAGSGDRPPLGRAQVTMTIDNSDGALPIDYSEVTISRTMFRSGASEYAINGTACRLLDVQELLSDSGIGKEMHVIVGQGRLDDVLRATPEQRRGLIEEAAGVLKHRRRKEKALRKLEAMENNLTRVVDLAGEVRRQLGPLGRQAETARKAALWQAQLRDARLRLLADDLVQKQATLTQEQADDSALKARTAQVEADLAAARAEVEQAGARSAAVAARADEVAGAGYHLSALRDRFTAHARLAAERLSSLRHQEEATHARTGRDPEQLRADAARARAQEQALAAEVEQARRELEEATAARTEAESAHAAERDRVTTLQRAAADRREGLATLAGQVAAKQGRVDTLEAQLARAAEEIEVAARRAEKAERDYLALEAELAADGGDAEGVNDALTRAQHEYAAAGDELAAAQRAHREAAGERDRARARREALELALAGTGDAAVLLADDAPASLGPLAALLQVRHGHETAVAAALGALGESVTYASWEQALAGVAHLREAESGRAALVVADAVNPAAELRLDTVRLPEGAVWAVDVVTCPDQVRPAVTALLADTALVRDDAQAVDLVRDAVAQGRRVTAVTPTGDVYSPAVVSAGGAAGSSRLELQAARDEAAAREEAAGARAEETRGTVAVATQRAELAQVSVDEHTAALRASDAALAARTEKLSGLRATRRAAKGQVEQLRVSMQRTEQGLATDREALAGLQQRYAAAQTAFAGTEAAEPDTEHLIALEKAVADSRAGETSALLALRTAEERQRGIAGRADGLEAAARKEESVRADAARRRAALAARIDATAALREVALRAATRLELSIEVAACERQRVGHEKAELEKSLATARARADELAEQQRLLTDTAHREEMARTELRLRIEALLTKASEEYGVTEQILVDEYGPHLLIQPVPDPNEQPAEHPNEPGESADKPEQAASADRPVAGVEAAGREGSVADAGDPEINAETGSSAASTPERPAQVRPRKQRRRKGDPPTEPYPYVREEQEKLAADREKKLARLGRINPLALEEYAALEERHAYLNAQIEDLKAGKKDLLTIVADVDERVQKAFVEAFEDTAAQFSGVFSRLFPGGEGRLVLTEPDSPLTTGIEVEARPPGKKVKRLSLLSGGERSLTAMAFLVSIFKARPSPFYILDEVEAALDDVNLGRLLMLFEELRETSQLIVITHQKRTMERADALYGVTMRGDGVTTVVSQRIRGRDEPVLPGTDESEAAEATVAAG